MASSNEWPTATSPMIYLDHWALHLVSTDDALGGQLIAALDRSGGSA